MRLFRRHLKFDNNDLEQIFFNDYYEKSLPTVRIAIILGIVLYSAFGILDILIVPISKNYIWFIRFAIVVPVLILMFVITFFSFFKRYMQPLLSVTSLVAGLGIVAMIAISVETESSLYYYAGLMLVMMWTYTFVKLRFIYAVAVCWLIVLSYEITVIFFQGFSKNPEMVNIFINNNFFFISSNIIGMFACYLIELYTRKDFILRRTIEENREELKNERNQLKERMIIMNRELDMARIVQQKLIPTNNPNDHIFLLYKPMEAVGGDFLDFIKFESSDKIGIFLSDVSGHGVPAALITTMIKSSILESGRYKNNPAKFLMHLNEVLALQTEDDFITAIYGIYDKSDRSLVYANAGHHPPTIIMKKKISNLNGKNGLPLAIESNEEMKLRGKLYSNNRAVLPKNSKLILYTDGLVEARNINNKSKDEFGESIYERYLKLNSLHCKEFVESLYNDLTEFRGSNNFDDDICLVCMDVV